ncbi:hypothetical protein ACLKA7_012020 [Drosophila subpalustris]
MPTGVMTLGVMTSAVSNQKDTLKLRQPTPSGEHLRRPRTVGLKPVEACVVTDDVTEAVAADIVAIATRNGPTADRSDYRLTVSTGSRLEASEVCPVSSTSTSLCGNDDGAGANATQYAMLQRP